MLKRLLQELWRKLFNNKKTDPFFSFTSDFLKNSPEKLFNYLSIIIKSFLIHANTIHVLLLATLVPIIKDKMGDICSSKNYQSIAISSLILFHLNMIYNSHFYGSSLWNLFGPEMEKLENSWNLSFRIMFNLPCQTHRYFVNQYQKNLMPG